MARFVTRLNATSQRDTLTVTRARTYTTATANYTRRAATAAARHTVSAARTVAKPYVASARFINRHRGTIANVAIGVAVGVAVAGCVVATAGICGGFALGAVGTFAAVGLGGAAGAVAGGIVSRGIDGKPETQAWNRRSIATDTVIGAVTAAGGAGLGFAGRAAATTRIGGAAINSRPVTAATSAINNARTRLGGLVRNPGGRPPQPAATNGGQPRVNTGNSSGQHRTPPQQARVDDLYEPPTSITPVQSGPLRFGADDLVYGPSAGGRLRELADTAGGRTLTDLGNPPAGMSISNFSLATLDDALATGRMVRFDLSNVDDLQGVLAGTGRFGNTVTGAELRHICGNWSAFASIVSFYEAGVARSSPC